MNKIDENIYGFLLKHLYHSVSNGVWGETVWNRSFEEHLAYGKWIVDSDGLVRLDALTERGIFNLGRGNDYEIKLLLRKVKGDGTVFVGVRDQYRELMPTNGVYCYLGENSNSRHRLEASTGWIWHTPVVSTATVESRDGALEHGVWHSLRVKIVNDYIEIWLDETPLFSSKIDNCPKEGAVTLGAEMCSVEFREIEITSLSDSDFKSSLQPVRHWQLVGRGEIEATSERPLNHLHSVRIHAKSVMSGVEQPSNYAVDEDDMLTGSVYLRGEVDSVAVLLTDGDRVISKQIVRGISDD